MPSFRLPLFAAQSFAEHLEAIWRILEPRWAAFKRVLIGEDLLIQLAVIAGAVLLAYALMLGLRPLFKKLTEAIEERDDWIETAIDWVSDNLFRFLLVGLLWSASIWFDAYNASVALEAGESAAVEEAGEVGQAVEAIEAAPAAKNYILIRAMASFATLVLVSRALPSKIKSQAYFKMLFFILAIALLLNLLGIWQGIREGLNSMRLLPISSVGETRVTVFTLLKGVIAILIIVPLTRWLMQVSDARIAGMKNVSPALQVLAIKMLKVIIVAGAVLFCVSSLGVNLAAFAIFGGAVGLGLGFGFQKVVSNLVCGVILLGDRSIKPGDVIEVDDTYGWINKLGARYASVITRDGTEHLIPNETLITEKVVNWSFSDDKVRIKIPFGISYSSDIHGAMDLALQAGREHPRVIKDPGPVVRLRGYGDSSVNFELRVWILDPSKGVNNLKSDLYVRIWELFKEGGIEFPYPQRDLHIRDSVPLEVVARKE